MSNIEDLMLDIDCDDFICNSLMYQKVDWLKYGTEIDNNDGTYTQHYWDKLDTIKVSAKADSCIYQALKVIEKKFNTKL